MADVAIFGVIENGTYSTVAPNPHIDLDGTVPSGAYIAQIFSSAMTNGETASVTVRKDQNNWAIYRLAEFTTGTPNEIDLSSATLIDSVGTISNTDSVEVFVLEPIGPSTGDAYYAVRNGVLVDISDKIIDA